MNLCEIDAIIRRFFYVEKNSLFIRIMYYKIYLLGIVYEDRFVLKIYIIIIIKNVFRSHAIIRFPSTMAFKC